MKQSILSMVIGVVLTACIGGGGAGIRYYLVDPVPVSAFVNDDDNSMSLEIIDLRIPQYLERFQIVTRSGQNQMELSDTHQWGENLRKNLLRTLSVNLSSHLGTSDVGTPLNRSTTIPDFRVLVHIIKFERDVDGEVRLSARWQISTEEEDELGSHLIELTSDYSLGDGDYEGIVSAMQALFGELSEQIADSLRALQG